MIIYAESRRQFVQDVDANALQGKLVEGFQRCKGWVPADRSVWADEYTRFSLALRAADVSDDVQVAIEYHISAASQSRVDALLTGNDGSRDHAMVIELKAWSDARCTDIDGLVWAPLGGGQQRQHPCEQARRYKGLIARFNEDVRESGVGLQAAAYLFNLQRRSPEPLEDARYSAALEDAQLFLADDTLKLRAYFERYLKHRPSRDVLFLLEHGKLVPAPALVERVRSMLDGNEEFQLIDEQFEAYQTLRHALLEPAAGRGRHVFVVEGGPGTGKSVIAVRLLADVMARKRMGYLVAPNSAFRESLVAALAAGETTRRHDGQALIRSSWSFHGVDYDKGRHLDVLIVDEAHRLKDQAYRYPGESMVEDMVRAARVSVFFVDETQLVTWADAGSIARIQAAAAKFGASVHKTLPLRAQFRCSGSDGYLNWLDDVLQIRPTANFDNWADGEYEFGVFDRAEELHAALRERNDHQKARLIAGYAWEWPKGSRSRGAAGAHVTVDGLSLPWNYDDGHWATSPDGIDQVGCVHTSQGVEFDWTGVLVGGDLVCVDGQVQGLPEQRAKGDKSLHGWKKAFKAARGNAAAQQAVLDKVQRIIKNTYKVLMSRGRRGCFVWCADAALRDYFRARLALAATSPPTVGVPHGWLARRPALEPRSRFVPIGLPSTAVGHAGARGWIRRPSNVPPDEDLFVVQLVGTPATAAAGSDAWCLCRHVPFGELLPSDVILRPTGGGDLVAVTATAPPGAPPGGVPARLVTALPS